MLQTKFQAMQPCSSGKDFKDILFLNPRPLLQGHLESQGHI